METRVESKMKWKRTFEQTTNEEAVSYRISKSRITKIVEVRKREHIKFTSQGKLKLKCETQMQEQEH